ncbi:hypothetical protein WA588_002093 [Blastocystis sp. NMH]
MKARKLAEAQKHLEEAAKCMKTSFFKRKPDIHAATLAYFDAAQAFYVAEDLENAIEYYEKSGELDVEMEDDLSAAQKFEKCALLSIQRHDASSEKDAREFYDRCCQHYKLGNSMDKAAECLVKVAHVMEKTNINVTAGYMLRACNLMVNFDRQDFAVDTFNNTLNLLLRIGRFQSAIVLLRRMIEIFQKLQQEHNIFKCYLSIVIIYLGMNDVAAAQLEFNKHLQCDTYLRSSEIALEEDLVRACEDFDEDKLEELKKSNQLNFVQQQVNRIGKNLQVSMPVAWFCSESEELVRQASGDESVSVDLAPGKPVAASLMQPPKTVKKVKKVEKKVEKPTEKAAEKEGKPADKKDKPADKKDKPAEKKVDAPAEKSSTQDKPAEEKAEPAKPLSALAALEQAAAAGDDDDEFNLCSLLCSKTDM